MRHKPFSLPPASPTIARAIQPDYRKWRAVRIGMPRSEVHRLLGPPLTGREQRPITYFLGANYERYGFVSYPALPNKWEMAFIPGFDGDDRVWWKCDPFGGGPLSLSGKPSKPRMIVPQTGARFSHFPRLLDIRWFPCSGVYPITYELELGISALDTDEYRDRVHPQRFGQPYAVISFPGAQPGRIRVRGRNEKGAGPWSDRVQFAFEV